MGLRVGLLFYNGAHEGTQMDQISPNRMYLENGFEVECKAVPESELATGRASDETAPFRCPLAME